MNDFEDLRALDALYDALDEAEERERVRMEDMEPLECERCKEETPHGRALLLDGERRVLCDRCFDEAVDEYRARGSRRNDDD